MRSWIVAACLAGFAGCGVQAAEGWAEYHFSALGLDSRASLEANLAMLDDARDMGESSYFDTVWYGLTAPDRHFVMLAEREGTLAMISVSIDGTPPATPEIERRFGLLASDRREAPCPSVMIHDHLWCSAVYYGCTGEPPSCPMEVLVYTPPVADYEGSPGYTNVTWRASVDAYPTP